MTGRVLVAVGLLASTSACGDPYGPCFSERIEVTLSGTLSDGTASSPVTAGDQVAPGNIADFAALKRVLIDGHPRAGQVAWTVGNFGSQVGMVAVFMPGQVQRGQALPLAAIRGGGWGTLPGGSTQSASVDFRMGSFTAETVTGTLTVLETAPMRVRLAFTARDASGSARAVGVTAAFSFRREQTACD
jgi:hypothetical protein